MDVLKIIASILHLGNIKFHKRDEICKIENIGTIRIVAEVKNLIILFLVVK